ncbi:unnamed protein product, partial [Laminaria digitata]
EKDGSDSDGSDSDVSDSVEEEEYYWGECDPEAFDPEKFDPMSVCLDPYADVVLVDQNSGDDGAQASTDCDAIILDEAKAGEMYNRRYFVSKSDEDTFLFGYNFADHDRDLINSRDRNSMDQNRTRRTLARLLCQGVLKSGRVRRRILKTCVGYNCPRSEDIDLRRFDKNAIAALQEESRIVYPGKVLMYNPSEIA